MSGTREEWAAGGRGDTRTHTYQNMYIRQEHAYQAIWHPPRRVRAKVVVGVEVRVAVRLRGMTMASSEKS